MSIMVNKTSPAFIGKTNYKKVNKYKILYTIIRAKKKINRGPQSEEQGSTYLDGRVIEGSSERWYLSNLDTYLKVRCAYLLANNSPFEESRVQSVHTQIYTWEHGPVASLLPHPLHCSLQQPAWSLENSNLIMFSSRLKTLRLLALWTKSILRTL